MVSNRNLLTLLQITDSMFPTGSFVHSNGLETYTQQDIIQDLAGLKALTEVRLLSASRSDMIFVKAAMQAAQNGDFDRLYELDDLLCAMKTVQEVREASVKIGKQFLRSVLVLLPVRFLQEFSEDVKSGRCQGHLSVVFGVAYAVPGIDIKTALFAFTYQIVAGQASAAIKLMSVGQSQMQTLIHDLQPAMEKAVEIALESSLEDCQSFTPALDIRGMQHEYLF
ncbi:MAG TPA: urease accessory protein UreF, partial [Aggregatilineales bacterium]|nr:urease accessory protein UreF [Aggregatilineales bacterium]